jgi:DNA-binding response OmpR family regulator
MPGAKIVVVEDPLISRLVSTVLRRHGCDVTLVEASEAAELFRENGSARILITNLPEPFLEFAERLPLLYLSSQPNPAFEAAFQWCQVVLKPFQPQELVQAVKLLSQPV